jgi:hypothetical protein
MALQNQLSPDQKRADGLESCPLSPSAARAEIIDRKLRAQLVDSFCHLAECVDLESASPQNLELLKGRIRGSSVSPWVFCLYSKLVAELSKERSDDAGPNFSDILTACSLAAEAGITPLGDSEIADSWWSHFKVLFDTDSERIFHPQNPNPETFLLCKREVEGGLSLLRLADPHWHDEIRSLLRMIVVGSGRLDTQDLFNGASTFFFWGGSLINAELRRSEVSIIDLLVHESSHLLLFGLSAEGPLLLNEGHERYSSPLRADPRPIDGILHACFVATRVHLAMSRLLESDYLSDKNQKRAADRRDLATRSAGVGLDVLNKNARPTELGENVLDSLRSYWTAAIYQ